MRGRPPKKLRTETYATLLPLPPVDWQKIYFVLVKVTGRSELPTPETFASHQEMDACYAAFAREHADQIITYRDNISHEIWVIKQRLSLNEQLLESVNRVELLDRQVKALQHQAHLEREKVALLAEQEAILHRKESLASMSVPPADPLLRDDPGSK